MISAAEYNRLVRLAMRNEPLQGLSAPGGATGAHKWEISTARVPDDPEQRTWRIFVGTGTVSDQVPAITYLRTGDPRGWQMPEDYAGAALMRKLYGDAFLFVDRPMLEREDPPHLLVQAPSASNAADLGDFRRVENRERIPHFRSAANWEYDLYVAHVFLTAQPLRVSRAENRVHMPLPTRNGRFRLYAGQLPQPPATVAAGGHRAIGRLWLLRKPGTTSADFIEPQHLSFHSLWTANAEPTGLGDFDASLPGGLTTGLAGGLGDGLGAALVSPIGVIVDLALAQIAALFEEAASVQWWSV